MLLLPAFVAWGPEIGVPMVPAGTSIVLPRAVPGAAVPDDAREATMAASTSAYSASPLTWISLVEVVYASGVVFFLLRMVLGLQRAREIRREAERTHGRPSHAACATPMTVGLLAPEVILPADWTCWDEEDLSAVLAHEAEHVRRHDPLIAALTLLNRAVFWFHPLAWWLPRHISRLAEQACDSAVIARGHDRDVYATCLIRFARRVTAAGGRIIPASVTMPGAGLADRLRLLARPPEPHLSRPRLAAASLVCAALVVVCAAASPRATPLQAATAGQPVQTGWMVYASDHFDVYHDGLPDDRLRAAARDAETAYSFLSAALKHDLPHRVIVVLVRRDVDLAGAAVQVTGQGLPGADASRQRLLVSLESLDRGTNIIVHELTHEFALEIIPKTSRSAPALVEGLAEHQRGAWDAEDLRKTREAVGAGSIPSMASVSAAERHWGHAAFDFVASEHGAEGVRRLLFALRAHETLERAVPMAFGETAEQFDQRFRGYVATRFRQP
jgi:beta-lactamase regulating signal transducer with metallopeptidase domain